MFFQNFKSNRKEFEFVPLPPVIQAGQRILVIASFNFFFFWESLEKEIVLDVCFLDLNQVVN
jgi:hypothetical protein